MRKNALPPITVESSHPSECWLVPYWKPKSCPRGRQITSAPLNSLRNANYLDPDGVFCLEGSRVSRGLTTPSAKWDLASLSVRNEPGQVRLWMGGILSAYCAGVHKRALRPGTLVDRANQGIAVFRFKPPTYRSLDSVSRDSHRGDEGTLTANEQQSASCRPPWA